jgi:predicted hydrolase (HD superfamily)
VAFVTFRERKGFKMIPTREQAYEILCEYNTEEFHLKHAETVEGVMRHWASEIGEDQEYWGIVGLLHDLDFEMYPDQHCIKTQELLREKGVDKGIIWSCVSHGYGMTAVDISPESTMEKVLFAIDELTGLIGAAALMRPSRSVEDMEVKSLKKKFKSPSFAAGCSREVISKGADLLGLSLDELMERTLKAMQAFWTP